jgi:hypothetical protein
MFGEAGGLVSSAVRLLGVWRALQLDTQSRSGFPRLCTGRLVCHHGGHARSRKGEGVEGACRTKSSVLRVVIATPRH